MDLRSKGSKARKRAEARAERENAARQREMAREFYAAAQRKQLEEESMDRKSTKTAAYAEELRRHRDDSIYTGCPPKLFPLCFLIISHFSEHSR